MFLFLVYQKHNSNTIISALHQSLQHLLWSECSLTHWPQTEDCIFTGLVKYV